MIGRVAVAIILLAVPAWAETNPSHPVPGKPASRHGAPVVQPRGGQAAHRPRPAKPPPKPPVPVAVPAPPPAPPVPAGPTTGSNSGAPLPRFASLRSDDVNMRAGPGTRYPVDWVYKRRDLPVEIEREFEVWRLVTDPEGTKGWVNAAVLVGRRTGVVTGEERVLRRESADTAPPVARLKPGVIVRLRSCDAGSDWCQVAVQDYRGWLKRSEFWGTLPNEVVQ